MLNFQFDTENLKMTLSNGTRLFDLYFVDISKDTNISSYEQTTTFPLDTNTQVTIFEQNKNIEIVFSEIHNDVHNISIRFSEEAQITKNKNNWTINANGQAIYLNIFDGNIQIDEENNAILTMSNQDARMSFEIDESLSMGILTTYAQAKYLYPVEIDQKMPEFSINFYDNDTFTIPRPLYNNQPVLSCYPSNPVENDYLSIPTTRTVYVMVVCDTLIEPHLTTGQISPNIILKIAVNRTELNGWGEFPLRYYAPKIYTCEIEISHSAWEGEQYFDITLPMTIKNVLSTTMSMSLDLL